MKTTLKVFAIGLLLFLGFGGIFGAWNYSDDRQWNIISLHSSVYSSEEKIRQLAHPFSGNGCTGLAHGSIDI